MPTIFFSRSYREPDERINRYFLDLFAERSLRLVTDADGGPWCVPKLEKYAGQVDGMISVIPQRTDDRGVPVLSPYLKFELNLARRARIPLLAFVDDWMLAQLPREFPAQAIPFDGACPEADQRPHEGKIEQFCDRVQRGAKRLQSAGEIRRATVFLGNGLAGAAGPERLLQLLSQNGFRTHVVEPADLADCLEEMRVMDAILESEVSVFCLGAELSHVDIALAVAHAHCRPAFRLRYDEHAESPEPTVTGLMRWRDLEQLAPAFETQVATFKRGCVQTYLTRSTSDVLPQLERLQPHAMLDHLMHDLRMPPELRPPKEKTHAARCLEVIEWANASNGCGAAQLQLRLQELTAR